MPSRSDGKRRFGSCFGVTKNVLSRPKPPTNKPNSNGVMVQRRNRAQRLRSSGGRGVLRRSREGTHPGRGVLWVSVARMTPVSASGSGSTGPTSDRAVWGSSRDQPMWRGVISTRQTWPLVPTVFGGSVGARGGQFPRATRLFYFASRSIRVGRSSPRPVFLTS